MIIVYIDFVLLALALRSPRAAAPGEWGLPGRLGPVPAHLSPKIKIKKQNVDLTI
jgi:hypothetical protein